MLNKVK